MVLKRTEELAAWLSEYSLVSDVEHSSASSVVPDASYRDVVQRRRLLEYVILQPAVVLYYRVDENEVHDGRVQAVVEQRELKLDAGRGRLRSRFSVPPWSVVDADVPEKRVYYLADYRNELDEIGKQLLTNISPSFSSGI